jgi:uncharacterized protein involved in exopolysaccharide biosynthesis
MPTPQSTTVQYEPPVRHAASPASSGHGDESSQRLHRTVQFLAARWWVLALSGLVAGALMIGVGLATPHTYTSSASFVLQGGRTNSGISNLASQLGISVPAADPGQSPAFYAEVARSRAILAEVAADSICDPCEGAAAKKVPVSSALGIREPDSLRRADRTLRLLRRAVDAQAAQKTGIISVSVTTRSPIVAQQIATLLLSRALEFNLRTRQSQASAERRFTERRLQEVDTELRVAEQQLKYFRETNRFANSPELQLRESRLEREVLRHEEIRTALVRAYEQARIDEVRDTPTFALLDPPARPLDPNPRGLVARGLMAALLGMLLAAAMLYWRHRRSFELGGRDSQ